MKRCIKIVLSSILTLITLVIIYAILVIKGIFPNPFIDTKDLVCTVKEFSYMTDLVMTFNFDKNAIIKSYTEEYIYFIENEEELKKTYNNFLNNSDREVTIDGNKIITTKKIHIEKDKGYYGKTKKEMKKIYVEELFYDCK